jgi:formamidopyrimidine-DNA glycosylase
LPELPDITVYVEHLERLLAGAVLERTHVRGLNLLRTFEPPLGDAHGRRVAGARRLGKRVVLELDGPWFLVLHLMIAGRLHWHPAPGPRPGRATLATFAFDRGTLTLTEAGTHQRASLHVVAGEAALGALDPGGLEVRDATLESFAARLKREE